jgi:hypothetical protein
MPHKKKPGIAVIISIGKKPKPDMKKYVGDAMPNVMNKAWGFLKALPEQQAFRQTQYHTRPDGSEHYENSPPHTIHPAIAGLMDRTQQNPNPHEAFSRDRRIIPNTKAEGMIQEIHGLDDEDVETLPPPSGSPQDTIDNLPHPLARLIGEHQRTAPE